jgi:phage gp29-like protein
MADWVDKQISKLVLGQTMTTDEGASRAQSETHEKARDDIADSDIQQIVDTLNACLTVPYVILNFGEREAYPKIDLYKPDEKNIDQIISAVEKLGPQGLKVKAGEVRSLLGLSNPEDGDELIGGRPEYGQTPDENADADAAANVALNADKGKAPSAEIDALIDESENESGYVQLSDGIAEVIEKAADAATDFDGFRKELQKLVTSWPPDKIAERVAVATFKARALGDATFDKE